VTVRFRVLAGSSKDLTIPDSFETNVLLVALQGLMVSVKLRVSFGLHTVVLDVALDALGVGATDEFERVGWRVVGAPDVGTRVVAVVGTAVVGTAVVGAVVVGAVVVGAVVVGAAVVGAAVVGAVVVGAVVVGAAVLGEEVVIGELVGE